MVSYSQQPPESKVNLSRGFPFCNPTWWFRPFLVHESNLIHRVLILSLKRLYAQGMFASVLRRWFWFNMLKWTVVSTLREFIAWKRQELNFWTWTRDCQIFLLTLRTDTIAILPSRFYAQTTPSLWNWPSQKISLHGTSATTIASCHAQRGVLTYYLQMTE